MTNQLKSVIIGLFRQGATEKEMEQNIGLPFEDIATIINLYFLNNLSHGRTK